jgi:hypothetical protein
MSSTNLGKYTYGEAPAPLAVTLYKADGVTPETITGYSVEVDWKVRGQTPADTANRFSGSVSDGVNGVVAVPWGSQSPTPFEDASTPPYVVEMEVWAGNTTIRTGSQRFRFAVIPALNATTPTV